MDDAGLVRAACFVAMGGEHDPQALATCACGRCCWCRASALLRIDPGGGSVDADMLRVGRVGLYYRTIGDGRLGYWNAAQGQWSPLPNSPYRRLVDQGLRVARQEIAPELVSIPLVPSEVERP